MEGGGGLVLLKGGMVKKQSAPVQLHKVLEPIAKTVVACSWTCPNGCRDPSVSMDYAMLGPDRALVQLQIPMGHVIHL